VHSGGASSAGELLKYFHCVFTNIGVLTFTIRFSMQEKYAEQVTKTHGEDFDWENQPVDSQAVYVSGGGKAHGR